MAKTKTKKSNEITLPRIDKIKRMYTKQTRRGERNAGLRGQLR